MQTKSQTVKSTALSHSTHAIYSFKDISHISVKAKYMRKLHEDKYNSKLM